MNNLDTTDTTPTAANIRLALKIIGESGYKWAHKVLVRAFGNVARRPLTGAQEKVYGYIAAYIEKHGKGPTLKEIADACEFKSLATPHMHLNSLERKGWLVRESRTYRGIRLLSLTDQ